MNTATRVYGKSYVQRRTASMRLSLKFFCVGVLVLGLLISAFGVIYAKDLNRRLFIQYEALQQQEQQYQVEWSKLLLEQGAWSTQARIQRLAQQQLNMVIPSARNVVFVKDKGMTFVDNE